MATDLTYAYAADITKAERDANGDLYVYGKATGPDRDLDGQRCDPDWLKSAMPEWFEWGNVREMHQPIAAGVGVALIDDGDDWFVKSLVVDDGTAKRIEKKVLKGYSIGIKDPHIQVREGQEWIVGGNICEISYVDRPCNPTAKLAICKAAGADGSLQPVEADTADQVTIKVAGSVFTPADLAKVLATKKAAAGGKVDDTDTGDGADEVGADPADGDGGDGQDDAPKAKGKAKKKTKSTASDTDSTEAEILAALVKQYGFTLEQAAKVPAWLRPVVLASAAKGAMPPLKPGGKPRYPINNVQDLKDAIQAFGRGKDSDKDDIKAHIKSEAKRLGRADLIPDNWKATTPDLPKEDSDGADQKHDPAELRTILTGLVGCMKAELDELLAGENELCDLYDLLSTISMFCRWWSSEAAGGETDSPYGGTPMSDVSLAADPDTTKSVSTTDTDTTPATGQAEPDDTKTTEPDTATAADGPVDENRLAELVKSAIATEKQALTEAAEERTKALTAELDKVKAELAKVAALPEPGGPVITRTSAQAAAAKAVDADALKREADALLAKATDVETYDARLANGYRMRAAQLLKNAAA